MRAKLHKRWSWAEKRTSCPRRRGCPIQRLGCPGGNITGLSLQSIDTIGKRLELIKELVHGDAPVAAIWPGFGGSQQLVADLALKNQLPSLMLFTEFAKVGGLLAYGPKVQDLF